MGNLRKERDELVILVATGDRKTNALRFHLLILRQKTFAIIGLLIAQKGAIHIDCN